MNRTSLSFALASVILVLAAGAYWAMGAQPTRTREDALKTVEGLELKGNQLKVKAGYHFVKISKSKGAIQRMAGRRPGAPGAVEVDCMCKSAEGSCDIEILSGDVIRCQPSGQCTGCERVISVPGRSQFVIH